MFSEAEAAELCTSPIASLFSMRQGARSAEASAHPLLYLHQPPCCAGGRQKAEGAERQRQHARADAEQDAGHERRDDPREPRKGGGDPGRRSAVRGKRGVSLGGKAER